jgi:hypothetical protein
MGSKKTKTPMEAVASQESIRRYEKGERRHKHVGTSEKPEIAFHPENPKYWVGKCPRNISDDTRSRLLNEAIAADNGDRSVDFPKKLYVVDNGAIYVALTTTRGKTCHGYPYKGKIAKALLEELRQSAVQKNCKDDFEQWVKKYIELHGSW